jgi:hypothetical protein
MPIELSTPITVPSVNADAIWIKRLQIVADGGNVNDPVRACVTVCPYDSQQAIIVQGKDQLVIIDDVLTAALSSSTLSNAVGAIYVAVGEICNERNVFGQITSSISGSN